MGNHESMINLLQLILSIKGVHIAGLVKDMGRMVQGIKSRELVGNNQQHQTKNFRLPDQDLPDQTKNPLPQPTTCRYS